MSGIRHLKKLYCPSQGRTIQSRLVWRVFSKDTFYYSYWPFHKFCIPLACIPVYSNQLIKLELSRKHWIIRSRRFADNLRPVLAAFSCYTQSIASKKRHRQNTNSLSIRSRRVNHCFLHSINKATEVAAAFRGYSAFDPAVRLALALPEGGLGGRYLALDKLAIQLRRKNFNSIRQGCQ